MKLPDDLTIFVVEDDAGHARLIELVFRGIGVTNAIVRLQNAADVEKHLFSRPASPAGDAPPSSLVLLDLNLPGLDGHEVLERLRASEEGRHVPVIIITSSIDPDEEALCHEMGADAFLAKPPLADELENVLVRIGVAFEAA